MRSQQEQGGKSRVPCDTARDVQGVKEGEADGGVLLEQALEGDSLDDIGHEVEVRKRVYADAVKPADSCGGW
eukprot:598502-Hanusia_phi.AAC.1